MNRLNPKILACLLLFSLDCSGKLGLGELCYKNSDCESNYCRKSTERCDNANSINDSYPNAGDLPDTASIEDAEAEADKGEPSWSPAKLTITAAAPDFDTDGSVNFGQRFINRETLKIRLTVLFTGDTAAEAVSSVLNGFFQYTGGTYPGTGGTCGGVIRENCTLMVIFRPTERANVSEELDIRYTSAGVTKLAFIRLKGTGIIPAKLIAGDSPKFEFWDLEVAADKDLQLENTGDAPAAIVSTEFSDRAFRLRDIAEVPAAATDTYCSSQIDGDEAGCLLPLQFVPAQENDTFAELTIRYHNGIVLDILKVKLKAYKMGFVGNIGWGKNSYFQVSDGFYQMQPRAIAKDSKGNLFVSDAVFHLIHKFDSNGGYIGAIGRGTDHFNPAKQLPSTGTSDRWFKAPGGMAIDSKGNLFIADSVNNRVQKWQNCNGVEAAATVCEFVGNIGGKSTDDFATGLSSQAGKADRFFNYPAALALDSSENLFVSDNSNSRVQKWTNCGGTGADATVCRYVGSIGGKASDNFSMGIPPVYGKGDRFFMDPYGVTVDTNGNLFISEAYNNRIQKWANCNKTGTEANLCQYIGAIGGKESDDFATGTPPTYSAKDRYFSAPSIIAVDPSGNLYISDGYNRRVQKWQDCGGTAENATVCSYVGAIGNKNRDNFERDVSIITSGPNLEADRYFNIPHGLTVDSSGNLFIGESSNKRIQWWSSCNGIGDNANSCLYQGWLGGESTGFRTGLAPVTESRSLRKNFVDYPQDTLIDNYGNLFIANGLGVVQKWQDCMTGECTFVGWIGGGYTSGFHTNDIEQNNYPQGPGHFSSPYGLAMDSQGNLFISDSHKIQKWRDCAGDGACTFVGWLGMGQTAGFHTNTTITAYTTEGNFSNPAGIVLDSLGNLYVADRGNSRIQKWLDCGGEGSCTFYGWLGGGVEQGFHSYPFDYPHDLPLTYPSFTKGYFYLPRGVALDSIGNLYIADTEHDIIQKWSDCVTGECTFAGYLGRGALNGFYYGNGAVYAMEKYEDGYFCRPSKIIINEQGDMYIANRYPDYSFVDLQNGQIQKWEDCATGACSYAGWIGGGKDWWHRGKAKDISFWSYPWDGFFTSLSVSADINGNIYISELYRISKWRAWVPSAQAD